MGLQQYFDNKRIKKMMKLTDKIVTQHTQVSNIEDSAFVTQTQQFKDRLKNGENEEQVQIEAYALAREAAKRVLGLEAYPVQLVGGLILSEGNVAEMKTGEGKTLVSLFAIYFEALNGSKVHLVTANDYLAERDKSVIGPVLEFLGLTVGLNVSGLSGEEKKAIYKKDVIYSTASELGFDYLRDNMVKNKFEQVQSGLDYVLIDEADSILIDEARTPLIISGQKKEDLGLYKQAKIIVSLLKDDEYEYNIESNSVWLSEAGMEKVQNFWKIDDLYSLESQNYLRATNLMLRAYFTMTKDKDYVVSNGEVVLVDQNTGRVMDGRRFSEGLHQAIEAKESVEIKDETMTLATVTIQNYFRMYKKIAGMTGTAKTEEEELQKIYNLDVLVVPTHRPIARIDDNDEIYLDKEEKAKAIIREIKERHEKGQPILVGTSSIEDNEWLSGLFSKNGIKHEVLNAKNHEREAEIISNAGQKGAVTISTNMAGRGTDIKLGDNVKELGGLAVIGTEKHESRRVDNQLKGRSGRQGDPGYSKFILSLEDDLIKRFNGQKIKDLAMKLKFPKEEPIKDRMVARAISSAQKRMEGSNFDIRKNLLEYDEVMDLQRKFIYNERTNLMAINETNEFTEKMITEFICEEVRKRYDDGEPEEIKNWIINELIGAVEKNLINLDTVEDVEESLVKVALKRYRKNKETIGTDIINQIEKAIFMDLIDQFWVRHLDQLVQLKEGIHLRAYAQTNPLIEYQREAAAMFQDILAELRHYYCMNVLHFDISNIAKG